jgi:uncharacterized protein (TIGR03089 family)
MATPTNATTFPAALARLLRADSSRPLVTFYDDASGERVELSVATYANWVAKTACLAQDELDVTRGDLVLVDLPTHWLGAVWLGAAWSLGAAVTTDPALAERCALVVCGPDVVVEHAARAGASAGPPVVALSLRPLGGRFGEPLPDGVTDYGAVVLGQPDVFAADDPPDGEAVGWRDVDGSRTQAELLTEAEASAVVGRGGRLLTDHAPTSRAGLVALLAAVVRDAGTVWVRNPDQARWAARAGQERATAELRAG